MKYKEFEWIRRIIRSCHSWPQLRTPITRLIQLFTKKYQDFGLTELLRNERDNHWMYGKDKESIVKRMLKEAEEYKKKLKLC
jgi:hypothetical protein